MNPLVRLRWTYALVIVFLVLFCVQLTAYIVNVMRDEGPQRMMIAYAEGGIVLGYTLVRAIWRIGAQAYLSRRWIRRFRASRHRRLTKRLSYRYRHLGTEIMVVKDEAFVALAIGMRKPTIVVSDAVLGMFGEEEVKAIILHEWHHCRNRDNAKLFFARLLAEAFGYFPMMRPFYRYYQTWAELLADRFAMRRMGTELPLARVLLKLSRLSGGRPHPAAVHFASATMHYRIAQVLEPDKTVKVKAAVLRPLLISLSLLLFLTLSGDS